jgi:hypothetical protein
MSGSVVPEEPTATGATAILAARRILPQKIQQIQFCVSAQRLDSNSGHRPSRATFRHTNLPLGLLWQPAFTTKTPLLIVTPILYAADGQLSVKIGINRHELSGNPSRDLHISRAPEAHVRGRTIGSVKTACGDSVAVAVRLVT